MIRRNLLHAPTISPDQLCLGRTLILVPHMDDAVLGCGGTIAQLSDKNRVAVVYATDGRGSPEPIFPLKQRVSENLNEIRAEEAKNALTFLGINPNHIYFLNLPDGQLQGRQQRLQQMLLPIVAEWQPATILAPFRFDRHSDHIAANLAAFEVAKQVCYAVSVVEYFVYHQWRLLTSGDVRSYVRAPYLKKVDIDAVSAQKRAALDFFKSQTTIFYEWQTRPNLRPELLDAAAEEPEYFLDAGGAFPGAAILEGPVLWIRAAHRLEPYLKRKKDRLVARLRSHARIVTR